jgi:hypothetical protein
VSLPFGAILLAEQTIEETHRYRLTLHHRPIDRPRDKESPWDLPAPLAAVPSAPPVEP